VWNVDAAGMLDWVMSRDLSSASVRPACRAIVCPPRPSSAARLTASDRDRPRCANNPGSYRDRDVDGEPNIARRVRVGAERLRCRRKRPVT